MLLLALLLNTIQLQPVLLSQIADYFCKMTLLPVLPLHQNRSGLLLSPRKINDVEACARARRREAYRANRRALSTCGRHLGDDGGPRSIQA